MRYAHIYQELKLDKKSKIIVCSARSFKELEMQYEGHVIFFDKGASLIIGKETIICILERFLELLSQAIRGNLMLDESCHNIGYVDNAYDGAFWVYDDESQFFVKKDSNDDWIGYKYDLFSSKNKSTWLYNDMRGNIVLEITPSFNVLKYKNKALFEKWLRNYKPLLKRIIKPEIAYAWLEQIRALLRTVRINSGIPPE